MSKKQQILEYEKQFKELKGLKETVRKLPGMYIGALGNKGVLNMIREVFQNSCDELMRTDFCDTIHVHFDEKNFIISIADNGKGIPFNMMVKAFINQHLSTNYEKKLFNYSSGRHGIGAKVTNVLSEFFVIESYILGKAAYAKFEEGELVNDITMIENSNNLQGTKITFKPSSYMGDITLNHNDIFDLFKLLFPLTKIGSRLIFTCITKNNKEIKETIINSNGIYTHLNNISKELLIPPIHIYEDNGLMRSDILFSFNIYNTEAMYMSFANYTPVVGGTHIDAFIDAVCKYFKDYMNKIYLTSTKSKLTIVNNDIKSGLIAVISVCHLEPIFVGQSKDMLSNEDIIPFIKELTYRTLDEWCRVNSRDLQKLCKFIKEIAEIRLKSEEGKIKLTTKYESSSISGMPKKYVKPSGRDSLELLIVEGDSALGPAKNNRCNKRQALFPIRGKLPNAFSTPPIKFLSNEEVASIITIIGAGYGKSFDLDKCRFDKIIFMTDSDSWISGALYGNM